MDGVSQAALIRRSKEILPFLVGMENRHRVGEAGKSYLGINDLDL
jgi:hypothetical protein